MRAVRQYDERHFEENVQYANAYDAHATDHAPQREEVCVWRHRVCVQYVCVRVCVRVRVHVQLYNIAM